MSPVTSDDQKSACKRFGHVLPSASAATGLLWCLRCSEPIHPDQHFWGLP